VIVLQPDKRKMNRDRMPVPVCLANIDLQAMSRARELAFYCVTKRQPD
jgi:hypothetical protein